MKLPLEFDEKKLVAMLCKLDSEQAKAFMDAMHKSEKSIELMPILEEIIHGQMGDPVSRESRIAG